MTLYCLSVISLEKRPQLIHRPRIFCFLPRLKKFFSLQQQERPQRMQPQEASVLSLLPVSVQPFSALPWAVTRVNIWMNQMNREWNISPNNRIQFFVFSQITVLSWAKSHLNWRYSWHSALETLATFFLQYFRKSFSFVWDLFKVAVIIFLKIMVTGSDDWM